MLRVGSVRICFQKHSLHPQSFIRQQTTTVDYKRLINGLVLTRFASLRRKTTCIMETGKENEIVLYQPNDTVRLEVRIQEDSVWLTQQQIADLFGTKRPAITKHLKNIYSSGELDESSTCSILELMGNDGKSAVRPSCEPLAHACTTVSSSSTAKSIIWVHRSRTWGGNFLLLARWDWTRACYWDK